jgi:hypothetical protein
MAEDEIGPPLRGVVSIEWSDSGTGWGANPNLGWTLVSEPTLDPIRLKLLIGSVLDFLDQQLTEP